MPLPTPDPIVHERLVAMFQTPLWSVQRITDRFMASMSAGQTAEQAVQWLLDLGPGAVNVQDHLDESLAVPLFVDDHGVLSPHAKCLFEVLIDRGLDVNLKPSNNYLWPLETVQENLSLFGDWHPLADALIDAGVNVNAKFGDHASSFLHTVARQDPTKIALLLDHGANINALDNKGRTPLWDAAHFNQTASVEQLLTLGADPTLLPPGKTSILHAAPTALPAIVEALLKTDPPLNVLDEEGYSPLHRVIQGHRVDLSTEPVVGRNDVVRRLLAAGADPDLLTSEGMNAADLASSAVRLDRDLLKILADKGTRFDVNDRDGHSAQSRLMNRAQRNKNSKGNKEISPAEAMMLIETSALRRTLSDDAPPPVAVARSRPRL